MTRTPITLVRHAALSLRQDAGADALEAACTACGVANPLHASEDSFITNFDEASFIESLAAQNPDPDFSLRAGLTVTRASGIGYYVARHSRTLGDGLSRAEKFVRLSRPAVDFELKTSGNAAQLQMTILDPKVASAWHYREFLFGAVIGLIRAMTGRPFRPDVLTFRHLRAPVAKSERAKLGCDVVFSAEQDEIQFSAASLEWPLRDWDPNLRAIIIAQAETLAAAETTTKSSVADRVEFTISDLLPDVVPSSECIAREIGMSSRTLARRLSDEGTSFSDILSNVRVRLARQYLTDTSLQLIEISELLGYGTPSSFSTAFKARMGATPSSYRAAQNSSARQ